MEKTILSNRKIANFELMELIGSGGMANIYKGVQLSLDRPVALKVLHQHLTLNDDFVARFEKEAKQAALVAHPNIVAIIDYGHYEDEYFIAMEYIDGQNLKDIMTRTKKLPLEVAFLIAREVAAGLRYAHSNGLIHRDIKPANIILSNDGRVVITDFGIAKNHSDMSITATGQTIGSPAYMSPEQAAGRPIDHRCDIFSLGIVLYEIITGEKPFNGDTYQEMITSIISGTITAPGKLRHDITSSIEALILKALKKDIEGRYQDAEELAADIDRELQPYAIPSPKKLISEFLINPMKTTKKLRHDRVSKHMESALYLVNLGHGRLSDAIKEFEDVLRFDKNNKVARQYLEKLKSDQTGFNKAPSSNRIKKPVWITALIGGAALFIILLLISLIKNYAVDKTSMPVDVGEKTEILPVETESEKIADRVITGEIATVPLPPVDQPVEPPPQKKPTKQQSNVSAPKPKNPVQNSKPAPKSEKKVARAKNNDYNYPDQKIADYGLLIIRSEPTAVFSVNAKVFGKTNGPPVKLPPGKYTIVIEAKGFKTAKKRILVEKGKSETLESELKPDN